MENKTVYLVLGMFFANFFGGLQGMTSSAEMMTKQSAKTAAMANYADAVLALERIINPKQIRYEYVCKEPGCKKQHNGFIEYYGLQNHYREMHGKKISSNESEQFKRKFSDSSNASLNLDNRLTQPMSDATSDRFGATQAATSSTKLRFSKQCSMQAFKTPSNRNSSIKIIDEKIERDKCGIYSCPGCNFKNKTRWFVVRHIQSVLNLQEYECNVCCKKRFNSADALKNHVRRMHKLAVAKAAAMSATSSDSPATTQTGTGSTKSSSSSSTNKTLSSTKSKTQTSGKRKADEEHRGSAKKKSRTGTNSNSAASTTSSSSSSASSSSTTATLSGLNTPVSTMHKTDDDMLLFQVLPATPAAAAGMAAKVIAGHYMPVFKQNDINGGNPVSGTINIYGTETKVWFNLNKQQNLIPIMHCNVIDEARSRADLPAAPVPVHAPASVLPVHETRDNLHGLHIIREQDETAPSESDETLAMRFFK